jgi:hypothetical protein
MTEFLYNALTFPTIFYTGLLGLVVIYWLTSLFGFGGYDIFDADLDGTEGFASGLTRFHLDGIPLTLTLSLIIFVSWILCFYMVEFFILNMLKDIDNEIVAIALGFWLLLLSPILALPIVLALLAPFKPLMKKLRKNAKGASAHDFVGKTATVRSEKVNLTHGTVELSDGGAGLILQVRAEEPNAYKRGSNVILKHYIAMRNTYSI